MNWRDWKAMRRRVWRAKLLRRGLMVAALLLAGCDIATDVNATTYVCVVDGDTIHVPNDSTGVRCAPIEDWPTP